MMKAGLEIAMLKAVAFIIVVGLTLNLLGLGVHGPVVSIDGHTIGGFAGGLLAAGAALVALFLALGLLGALFMGLVVMAVGLPLFIVAVILCALLAPVLLPVLVLFAIGLMLLCSFGTLFA